MKSNCNFEQFHRNRPDFPRTKPNRRKHQQKSNAGHNCNTPNIPQPQKEYVFIHPTEDKPQAFSLRAMIGFYAVAFSLGVVIGLLI